MEPKRNTTTDSPSSNKLTTQSWTTTQLVRVTRRSWTHSLTWVTTNSNKCSAIELLKDSVPDNQLISALLVFQQPLTGTLKVQWHPSRTKDSAVLVGPSLPPVQLKELTSSKLESWYHYLNNNLLTAPDLTVISVATEDWWTTPSNTPKTTNLKPKPHIPTPLKVAHALMPKLKDKLEPNHTSMSPQTPQHNSKLPLQLAQFQLPLKLIKLSSNHTNQVSSPLLLVEPPLTTESWLLDMELKKDKTTGS